MNILLLAPQPFYANRGTPIAVKLVCEGLVAMGHTVDVLTYHAGEPVDLPGVTIHRIAKPPLVKNVPIGPSWQKLLCDVAMAWKLKDLIRQKRYDLLHAVEEAAFMAVHCGLPFVFDMDSLMSRQLVEKSKLLWPVAKVFEWLEHHALRRCRGALVVCPALLDEAKKYQRNVHLLPDVAMAGQAAGELPAAIVEARGMRFMYVGNLESYQGIDLMLEAFASALKNSNGAVLTLVGGSSEHINHYRRKAATLSIEDHVSFAGAVPVECLGRVLSFSDVLVSPRIKGNNTPMKLYSYLLSGKPVLATRLPTHTQVVTEEHALLVEPTVNDMAQGIRRLMDSKELRDRLGAAGRDLATRCYSVTAFRQRLEAFYQQIAA